MIETKMICDICGTKADISNGAYANAQYAVTGNDWTYMYITNKNDSKDYHLCVDCHNKIKKFIETLQMENV